jgi:hypothetical protein
MNRLTVICSCGNSFVVKRQDCTLNPGALITCDGLVGPEHQRCGRQYLASTLLKKMNNLVDVWEVPADYQAQLYLGQ